MFMGIYSNASELDISIMNTEGDTIELPKVSLSPEGEIIVEVEPGKVATLARPSNTQIMNVVLDTEIVENTCLSELERVKCTYKINMVKESFVLAWMKHPEQSKIGKLIVSKDSENDSQLDFFNFWAWETKDSDSPVLLVEGASPWSSKFKAMITNPVLTCEDMNWTQETFGKNKGNIIINEWTSEVNERNPETNLNENSMAKVYFNVEGTIKNQALEFKKFEYTPFISNNSALASFSLGDVTGWSIMRENKTCEVSLKIDKTTLINSLMANLQISKNIALTPVNQISKISDISFLGGRNSGIIVESKDLLIKKKGLAYYENLLVLIWLKLAHTFSPYHSNNQTEIEIVVEGLE